MNKYNLVLADSDLDYINNLMNYISQNYSHKFNVISFTEYRFLEEYINKNNKIDILFISPDFYKEDVLMRNGTVLMFLSQGNDTNINNVPAIRKYQSADKICSEIVKIFENSGETKQSVEDNKSTKVFTVFSPVGGIGKTTIALSLAYNLSQKGKSVLYISLEKIQSHLVYFNNKESKYNLSDLIFAVKQRDDSIDEILNKGAIKDKDTGIFYFNDTESLLDIEDLSGDDIGELLEVIDKSNLFQFVIFDLSASMNTKYNNLFKNSNKVIIPIGQDAKTIYLIDSFINQLDEYDNFFFVQNKVKEEKNKLMPKVILSKTRPIIESIAFTNKVDGNFQLKKIKEECNEFNNKINGIVINHVLF